MSGMLLALHDLPLLLTAVGLVRSNSKGAA